VKSTTLLLPFDSCPVSTEHVPAVLVVQLNEPAAGEKVPRTKAPATLWLLVFCTSMVTPPRQ
jgi:hypothetical protein